YGCEKHYHSYSCPYGYSSSSSSCNYGYDTASKSCSCGATNGTCYKCNAASSGGDSGGGGSSWQYIRKASTSSGTACWQDDGQWWHVCRADTYCKNGSTEKYICELSYAYGVGGAAQGWNKNSGFKTEAECRAAAAPNCASSVGEATLGSCDSSGNKSCSY
ncbi:MAG: hypothetical protein IJ479_02860, partial [Alphaproteobacteria bacterium]|nr:hypothetical protein [Alphaproteobacteria bacterium]